jgi:hypothetical protein
LNGAGQKHGPRRLILRPFSRAGCLSLFYLAPVGLISSNTGGDSSGDDSTGGDSRAGSRSSGDGSTGGDGSDDDNSDDNNSRPKLVLARMLGLMHRTVRLAL